MENIQLCESSTEHSAICCVIGTSCVSRPSIAHFDWLVLEEDDVNLTVVLEIRDFGSSQLCSW